MVELLPADQSFTVAALRARLADHEMRWSRAHVEGLINQIEQLTKQRDEGWNNFYALRKRVAEQEYPGMTGIVRAVETGAVPSDGQIDKFVDSLMGLFCVGDMVKTPHTMESVAREMMRNWLAGFRHETEANRMPVRASSEGEVSMEQHVQTSGLRAAEVPCSPPLICVHGHAENCPYCPPRLHPETSVTIGDSNAKQTSLAGHSTDTSNVEPGNISGAGRDVPEWGDQQQPASHAEFMFRSHAKTSDLADLIRSRLFQTFLGQGFWHAHHVDLIWRYDGQDVREEADWLKDIWYVMRGAQKAGDES